jgi:hypothetical protein
MVKVIIVPNVKPTLLPCFVFHVRRGVLGKKTEDAQNQNVRCRRCRLWALCRDKAK